MNRILVLSVGVVAVVALLAPSAEATVVTITLGESTSSHESLYWDVTSANPNQNRGGGGARCYFGIASYIADIFRFQLPADLIGGTINSAQFGWSNTWGNDGVYSGCEIRMITSNALWVSGGSTGVAYTGAGRYFANYNPTTQTGLTWTNETLAKDVALSSESYSLENAGLSSTVYDLATTGTADPQPYPVPYSFTLTSLVQAWANGSANNGFAIWGGNASKVSGTDYDEFQPWRWGTGGIMIDYTPVPEPATLTLLVLGGLAMMRRRK